MLRTARLVLRPRTMADLEANLAMDLDPAVHRYIYGRSPPEPAAHRARLAGMIEQGWPARGGLWVVEEVASPGLLGWCALFPLPGVADIEIGYRYVEAAWGRGIATEAGRRVLEHGFAVLGLAEVFAVTDPENRASQAVLAKLGLRPAGISRHYGRPLPLFRAAQGEVRPQ